MDKFRDALVELTNRIEFIINWFPSCGDTMVRDKICEILQMSLLEGNANQRPHDYYGAFNPIANLLIKRSLTKFLEETAVKNFIDGHDEETRLKLIRTMMSDGSVVSKSGETLDHHLGEWA